MAQAETATATRPAGLFSQLTFAIICRDAIDDAAAAKIADTIKLHAGEAIIHQPEDDPIGLDRVTHFLSSTFDFPEYDSACDGLMPVVRPAWIDASLAKDKLANPRAYSPDPRLFLSEVVVCCADLPEGDTDAIIGGVLAMGGLFANKITSQVTHLVALSMDSAQCVLVQNRKLNIKIVLPHWFDDCLKLGRRIDEQPYMLPNPEILRHSEHGPPKPSESKAIYGAVYPDPSSSQQLPSSIRGELNVFRRKHIMLASDLGIGSHLRGIFETIITSGGGQLAKTVRKADMLICKYREGDEYALASRLGKEVGNLGWLYWLITNNAWTSPMRRMLHYPLARAGIPDFRNFRISLSNYSGEARVYLENLINAAGAECTKTLKQDNTHLITAHTQSEKCAAAKDWNIHVVNHLWLEESYAKWKVQSVTDVRYTHFPQRTNLGEVVGQTKLDKSALEKNFFASAGTTSNGTATGRPMRPLDRNVVDTRGEPVDTSDAPTTVGPRAKKGRPARSETIERAQEKHRTPATSRFAAIDKENATPGTGSSRKSKEAAAARLQQMTPDIQLYEKERKRTGGVIYGGRRKNDADRVISRKRSVDETSDTDSAEDVEERVPKRARSEEQRPTMWLLVTGYQEWVGKPKVEETQRHQLAKLGIHITFDPSKATHLAAPKILRTAKFVTAMTFAPTTISTDFITECLAEDCHLNPDDFELKDPVNEKKFGISLKLAQERAKENQRQLLAGRTVFVMENVVGGFQNFKTIVDVNGGTCYQYTGRKGTMVPSRRAESEKDDDPENVAILISNPEPVNEKSLWSRFRQMAEGSRKTPKVVKSDWLLETAMCQKIQPTAKYELSDDL